MKRGRFSEEQIIGILKAMPWMRDFLAARNLVRITFAYAESLEPLSLSMNRLGKSEQAEARIRRLTTEGLFRFI